MKIAPIGLYRPISNHETQKNNKNLNLNNQYVDYRPVYYKDYNISFTGRTPEDFYAQDFNRNNMPITMRDYLDYDYQTRQHIPPEQMMGEVFKYLDLADDFEDVKGVYPHEDLFRNLHENQTNSRKGILSEIKAARELSDEPLLKDGSDNFGMYILKKIYREGKTLKEISKDFLEHDINDEYKGLITEPVQYSTLSAYGISYPKLAFWNSFINTRDEYKKFFVELPKDSTVPGVNTGSGSSRPASAASNETSNDKPQPKPKYSMKRHRGKQLQDDIAGKKSTSEDDIKKTVIKRFGKNDPEASFLVKYMSPIMSVATERAHMSEELKSFAETEKQYDRETDGQVMLKRFWKDNAYMLEVFSAAVVDTMRMFEDIYVAGGNIPINSDFEIVNSKSKNSQILDFVNEEFYDLLQYSKGIKAVREAKYAEHDKLQKQWEEHFEWRYPKKPEVPPETKLLDTPPSDSLNGKSVYEFTNTDGKPVVIVADLEEVWKDELKTVTKSFPSRFASLFMREMQKAQVPDKLKLTLAVQASGQKIVDDRIYTPEEFMHEFYELLLKFQEENQMYEHAARIAIANTIISHPAAGDVSHNIYSVPAYEYARIFSSDEDKLAADIIIQSKNGINSAYESLLRPLSSSEKNKIGLRLIDVLSNYNSENSIFDVNADSDVRYMILMLKDMMQFKSKKESFKSSLNFVLNHNPYARCLLEEKNDEYAQAKAEIILYDFIKELISDSQAEPYMFTIFNNETYLRYKPYLSADLKNFSDNIIKSMGPIERHVFFSSNDILKELSDLY